MFCTPALLSGYRSRAQVQKYEKTEEEKNIWTKKNVELHHALVIVIQKETATVSGEMGCSLSYWLVLRKMEGYPR